MRISIISRTFPPTICGVGDYSYWLANILESLNNEITVITTNKASDEKINVISIGKNWNILKLHRILSILRSANPDFIIIQYVCQLYGKAGIIPNIVLLVFLIKLKFKSIKLVITFHELWIPLTFKDFILGIIQRLEAGFIILMANTSIITTNTREMALKKLFPRARIYKIPVGSNIPNKEKLSPSIHYLKKDFTLGTFGRLHPERDLLTIISAIKIITVYKYNVTLKIIGKIDQGIIYTTLLKKIKDLGIEKNIIWTDSCSAKEIEKHITNLDIYLSPEIDGASGRRGALMAALSFGLPIIAYGGKDTEKIFENGENIILIPPRKPDILAQRIIELANDEKRRILLGEMALETFKKYFSWETIGRNYEEIFQSFFR
ncbi:MAG: glycosyltransferase family 4 protein [bacterium]|nr:glycosyltransferase family 4 protein [bacterium]